MNPSFKFYPQKMYGAKLELDTEDTMAERMDATVNVGATKYLFL